MDAPVSSHSEPHRPEGFSDGAFAIVITPLVLEIHRPDAPPGKLGEGLFLEWPSSTSAWSGSTITTWSTACARWIWLSTGSTWPSLAQQRSSRFRPVCLQVPSAMAISMTRERPLSFVPRLPRCCRHRGCRLSSPVPAPRAGEAPSPAGRLCLADPTARRRHRSLRRGGGARLVRTSPYRRSDLHPRRCLLRLDEPGHHGRPVIGFERKDRSAAEEIRRQSPRRIL